MTFVMLTRILSKMIQIYFSTGLKPPPKLRQQMLMAIELKGTWQLVNFSDMSAGKIAASLFQL